MRAIGYMFCKLLCRRLLESIRGYGRLHAPAPNVLSPQYIATEAFTDAAAAVGRLEHIYERNVRFLRDRFEVFVSGKLLTTRVRATYPFVRITTSTYERLDSRLSYGFVAGPGIHETTVTRPDLFRAYLTEQIGLLIENHRVPVEIGESNEPIPIHFAYRRDINIEAALSAGRKSPVDRPLRDVFDTPDLAAMDDAIANGTLELKPAAPEPLALFRAARVDYSLHRLHHYTGTDPEHFQNFVIFTNYQFYVDAFSHLCRERMGSGELGLNSFVEPDNVVTHNKRLGGGTTGMAAHRMPQMPAFHLVAPGCQGVTMINIGTGPSNARTITDHVAVLRPHAWLMLGHCAGLGTRKSSAITSLLTAMCGRITCSIRNCRYGFQSQRWPRCRSRLSRRSVKSPALRASN